MVRVRSILLKPLFIVAGAEVSESVLEVTKIGEVLGPLVCSAMAGFHVFTRCGVIVPVPSTAG